jgi:hypothetical protein
MPTGRPVQQWCSSLKPPVTAIAPGRGLHQTAAPVHGVICPRFHAFSAGTVLHLQGKVFPQSPSMILTSTLDEYPAGETRQSSIVNRQSMLMFPELVRT